jgi:hypothetical protein
LYSSGSGVGSFVPIDKKGKRYNQPQLGTNTVCYAKKHGGFRCRSHEAANAKKKLKKAKEGEDPADIKAATVEYLSTEEGIEQLEDQGKLELAEKFRALRNRKITSHNAHWQTNHKLMEPRAVRLRKKAPAYNLRGFDQNGIHRETGTTYDPRGWDQRGHHQDTRTEFGPDGFNVAGTDAEGYGRDGFKNGYNRQGFNKQGWDREGYLPNGFHHRTGLDRNGYDDEGWARTGLHAFTGKPYDADGYGRDGYHHITGLNRETGMTLSEELSSRYGHCQNAL